MSNNKVDKFRLNTKNIWFPNQVEPFSDDSNFKLFWAREKHRCLHGFYIADKQVYIPGKLYWYTVYWTIELDVDFKNPITGKISSRKGPGIANFRDIEWEVFNDLNECEISKEFYCLIGARGFGKMLRNSEPVMTENGEKPIGDCKVGDRIYGQDGKLTSVLGVYPQGLKQLYRMTLLDGRTIDSGEEHLWGVYKGKDYKVLSTKELMSKKLSYKHKKSGYTYKFYLPEIKPVEYSERDFKIHPYIIGALIGDGKINKSSLNISSEDLEIIEKFKKLLPDYNLKLDTGKNNTNKNISYYISYKGDDKYIIDKYGANPLRRELISLNLNKTCKEKRIPEIYQRGSIEQRMELLKGLMDTDGSINTEGSIEYTTINKKLAEDVLYLCRSLGIKCQLGEDNRIGRISKLPQGSTHITKNIYYRVFIRTSLPIFSLNRKLSRIKKRKRTNNVAIKSIEKIDMDYATCITVDNENKLFLSKDYIPTHNSFISSALEGWGYSLLNDAEILSTGGNTPDISKLNEKIEYGLSKLHPIFNKQRLKNDWKKEVRAGYIDRKTNLPKGSNSRIISRNYRDGVNTMATNGTRPIIQVIDEIGKIPNLRACLYDSLPSWMNKDGYFTLVFLAGTGGDFDKGREAGEVFNDPETFNIKSFTSSTNGKKISKFIPASKARNEYKEKWTLYKYLTEKFPEKYSNLKPHKDLEIEILVSNEEKCLEEFIKPRREIALNANDSNAIIKEKAYYPITPEECFLTVNSNDYPVEAITQHELYLEQSNFKTRKVELFYSNSGVVEFKDSNNMIVTDFPVKSSSYKRGVVEIVEPPIPNPPMYLYVAGIDPYKTSESDYSDSVGSVYIWKRKTSDMTEIYQDMPVAWYHGRPKDIKEWQENVRMLLKLYNASAMCESNDENFITYMMEQNEEHYLARGQSYLKEINPNSKFKGAYGMPATVNTIQHWNKSSIRWTKEMIHKEVKSDKLKTYNTENNKIVVLGVTKILDRMLLKELGVYNKNEGNYDRQRAFSIACAYARQLDANLGESEIDNLEYVEQKKVYKNSMFSLNISKENGFKGNSNSMFTSLNSITRK
jgi:hypothetical protein